MATTGELYADFHHSDSGAFSVSNAAATDSMSANTESNHQLTDGIAYLESNHQLTDGIAFHESDS